MGLLKSSCLELAEVRVEGGKGHQRHGWVLESLVRHQGRPKGTSTGGGDPPRDGNALSEREPNRVGRGRNHEKRQGPKTRVARVSIACHLSITITRWFFS